MEKTIYKNGKGSIININDVKDKYFSNWKIKDIAVACGCSWQQIGKIIWKEIPERRKHNYKYKINHSYFDKINTEEKAYIFGFLCADGCVSKKSSSELRVALQSRDQEIIQKIKAKLKSNSPVKNYSYKGKQYCRIGFYSEQICDDLKRYGCGIDKTIHLKWDNIKIPLKLMHHFIRGYFDGDGCLSFWMYKGKYLKCHWNITSTEAFVMGLRKFIFDKFGFSCYVSQRNENGNNTKTIELSGNKQILSIMEWLYKDANIYLQRKKEKYEEYLKIYEKKN
jgi:hypothetical protein